MSGPLVGAAAAPGSPSAAAFPQAFPAPAAHYAADGAHSRDLANLVSVWPELSGNGAPVWQPYGELRPHYEWFGLNGQDALRFDGSDCLVGGNMPIGSYTVLAMVELDALGGDHAVLGGLFGGVRLGYFGGSDRLSLTHHGVTIATSSASTAIGGPTLVRVTYDVASGVGTIALDGVVVGSGAGPANADPTLQFGATTLADGFRGAIAEVVVYGSVLGAPDLALAEAYLAARYQANTAPEVAFRQCPRDGELLPRDRVTNLASLVVSGALFSAAYTTARLEVLQDGIPFATVGAPLVQVGGGGHFQLVVGLPAGCHDYDLLLSVAAGGPHTYVHVVENVVVGDVLLIQGQSNAVAADFHSEALANQSQSPWIRSFGSQSDSAAGGWPPAATTDRHWGIADGEGWMSHGAVGAWALRLGEQLVARQGVPIAFLNGAVSGTAIAQHQRNAAQPADPTTIYGRLLWRAQTAGVATAARAMIWYQGESDYAQPTTYAQSLAQLHGSWWADYPALERVFVVQSRISCGLTTGEIPEAHRVAMDVLPVTSVMSSTALPGYDGCHYFYAGYRQLGDRLAALLDRDLYGAAPQLGVDAPNIAGARWATPAHTAIVVAFRNIADPLTLQAGAEQFFAVDDPGVSIQSASVSGNTITLQLSGASVATTIDYDGANGTSGPQPWIVNGAGVGALTFRRVPIL